MQTFESSDKASLIAGCKVASGELKRSALFRVVREGEVVFKGSAFSSIKHFKEEVESVAEGKEWGVQIQNFAVGMGGKREGQDFQAGDVIETYEYRDIREPLE